MIFSWLESPVWECTVNGDFVFEGKENLIAMLLLPQRTAINVAKQATRSVRLSLRISTGQDYLVENSVPAKKMLRIV